MSKTLTKLEIIDETVAYYAKDTSRRAEVDSQCLYLTDDGRMCAVGRCLRTTERKKWRDRMGSVALLVEGVDPNVLNDLWPRYQGHEVEFWDNLQRLHDIKRFWTNDGLSSSGQEYVADLKRKWA